MYEEEKEAAKADFIHRFVWNDESCVVLSSPDKVETRKCTFECQQEGIYRIHDYEDDVSGGAPLCEEHFNQIVSENPTHPAWVTQDPEKAWENNGGWDGLWFLFAPAGRYASPLSENPGEWPPTKEKDE